MFVILTSKPGQFHTEPGEGLRVLERYDYLFYGRCLARYEIAALDAPTRVRIVEDAPPHVVNLVPTKFLEQFDTLDAARGELGHLTRFGSMQAELIRREQ